MIRNPKFLATFSRGGVHLGLGDSLELSGQWPVPIVIVSDGPYGLGSFPGDPRSAEGLDEWYRPHIKQWADKATPQTTLWFWNSELGWATVHPALAELGWEYRCCHVWDKGKGHIAGNANSKTLRKFPVTTEVCVQYVKTAEFGTNGTRMTMQEWLRFEWARSGIPFCKSNKACGVKNAATRKYLTPDHLWYYPPVEMFVRLSGYANRHGNLGGKPYFSIDGKRPINSDEWSRMRAKFYCEVGISNVWQTSAVRGDERVKNGNKCAHMNQKPLNLIELILRSSSDPGDIVWEPFGGLCSVAVSSYLQGRKCYSAELLPEYFEIAKHRLDAVKRTPGGRNGGRNAAARA